jgi:hypothetical protein
MSCSTLYKVYKTKVVSVERFKNGHGTAAVLWGHLCEKYLNMERHSWLMGDCKNLWALYNNPNIPEHLRFALMATFDDGVVELCDMQRAADYALATYETIHEKDMVNHWLHLSAAYSRHVGAKDRRCVGLGLGCTSVSDPWEDFESRKPFSIMRELEKQKK